MRNKTKSIQDLIALAHDEMGCGTEAIVLRDGPLLVEIRNKAETPDYGEIVKSFERVYKTMSAPPAADKRTRAMEDVLKALADMTPTEASDIDAIRPLITQARAILATPQS